MMLQQDVDMTYPMLDGFGTLGTRVMIVEFTSPSNFPDLKEKFYFIILF